MLGVCPCCSIVPGSTIKSFGVLLWIIEVGWTWSVMLEDVGTLGLSRMTAGNAVYWVVCVRRQLQCPNLRDKITGIIYDLWSSIYPPKGPSRSEVKQIDYNILLPAFQIQGAYIVHDERWPQSGLDSYSMFYLYVWWSIVNILWLVMANLFF